MIDLILGIGLVILFIVSIWIIRSVRRLVLALASTNTALNETRTLVATQQKTIKRLIKDS